MEDQGGVSTINQSVNDTTYWNKKMKGLEPQWPRMYKKAAPF